MMATTYQANLATVPEEHGAVLQTSTQPAGEVPTMGTATDIEMRPDLWIVCLTFAVVAVTWLFAWWVVLDDKGTVPPTAPVAGLTIFAVFYVAAQALERLLEPISSLLNPLRVSESEATGADKAVKDAAEAVTNDRTVSQDATKKSIISAQSALDTAAKKRATSRANRTVAFWGIASALGVLSAASLKLYLLNRVGIGNPPRYLDILATGLVIGAGTKPVHDLVTLISSKAEVAKTESS